MRVLFDVIAEKSITSGYTFILLALSRIYTAVFILLPSKNKSGSVSSDELLANLVRDVDDSGYPPSAKLIFLIGTYVKKSFKFLSSD